MAWRLLNNGFMGAHLKPYLKLMAKLANNGFEMVDRQLVEYETKKYESLIIQRREAAKRYAKSVGVLGVSGVEEKLRSVLNEKIIEVLKRTKLKHAELAAITQIPRSRITAILNRRIKSVSIDTMISILALFGVETTIDFQ